MSKFKLIKSEQFYDSFFMIENLEDILTINYNQKDDQCLVATIMHIGYVKSIHIDGFKSNFGAKEFLKEICNNIDEKTLNKIVKNHYIIIVRSANNDFNYIDTGSSNMIVKTKDEIDIDTTIISFDYATKDADKIIKIFKEVIKQCNMKLEKK